MRIDVRSIAAVRPRAGLIMVRPLVALALLAPLAACDTIQNFNPFDKSEKYTPQVTPEVPADRLYNEGLALMNKGDYDGAAKKFADLDRQYPFSQWSKRALIMQTYSAFT